MRGIISPKLEPFLLQVNKAIADAQEQGVAFSAELVRTGLNNLSGLLDIKPDIALVCDKALMLENREIPVRIYHPSPTEKLPVLLHFHGGGHMCGSVELYDPISRQLAQHSHCIVICVDYRLAPEHPYPAGIDDCQHLLTHYKEVLNGLNYNDKLYIAGDSAGGAICTTLVMNNQKSNTIKIDKQVLIYPSVDYTMSAASLEENGKGYLLEKSKISWYFEQYFKVDNLNHPLIKKASPLLGNFSSNMPETFVITGGCDPLRDEGLAYIRALKNVNVAVDHHHFADMPHAFMLLQSLVADECEKSYQLIGQFLKS
ncbi:alpha/beta hydrolase [Thalassotalea piscium]|uniref:Acetyl esterase/lipase n=1 Tax=Thalassotalea piscium TaxID=1230533 RepID=A0A7X0NFR6_9GAMM|nr:alpha/beta hydrolase [Thalassotalea piscium]MBB6542647.1 acetyl esterase/lipase [Thalassotalea piscium]